MNPISQGRLFAPPVTSTPPEVHAAGMITQIKTCLSLCVKESGLSREQALDRINELAHAAGVRLTAGNTKKIGLPTFEKWLNPSEREHVPGVLAINIFCAVLGDTRPLAVQLAMHNCEVMDVEARH